MRKLTLNLVRTTLMEAMMNVPAEVTARRLRQAVVTRWNSVLEMISSLLTLKYEVNYEALKPTGNFDLVVKSVKWNIQGGLTLHDRT